MGRRCAIPTYSDKLFVFLSFDASNAERVSSHNSPTSVKGHHCFLVAVYAAENAGNLLLYMRL